MKFTEQIIIFLLAGLVSVIANFVGYHVPIVDSIMAVGLLLIVTWVGMGVSHIIPIKLPNVFWISVVAMLSTSSLNPFASTFITVLGKINFMAIATTILAYAGLSIGKDLKLFKEISWQMVIVALVVYTGTFVFATSIAQLVLKFEGVI